MKDVREADREYQEMKEFLSIFSEQFLEANGLPPEYRPIAVLEALEKKSKNLALRGLRQAVNDCIEMARAMKPDAVKRIDAELRERGAITLSEIRRRYSREYTRIVKRGKIANEKEYYLVIGILDDVSVKLAHEEREFLEQILSDYESMTASDTRNRP